MNKYDKVFVVDVSLAIERNSYSTNGKTRG